MKLREDEEELVLKWIDAQSVYGDSMRYLIQKDIAENGIRDIQQFVPRSRDIESIRRQLREVTANQSGFKPFEQISDEIEKIRTINETESITNNEDQSMSNSTSSPADDIQVDNPESFPSTNEDVKNRPAGKTYDLSVISSYQS